MQLATENWVTSYNCIKILIFSNLTNYVLEAVLRAISAEQII